MKLLRLILVLLLCATLPLSGLAASGLAGDCPMQMSMSGEPGDTMSMTAMTTMTSSMDMSTMAASSGMDHCDGMSMPSGGKTKAPLCKVAAQCNLGSLYHPAITPEVARAASVARKSGFFYTDALRSRAPDGLWRPPTSL
ncbi:hypothetical protein [Pandoraea capi]|uniref:hypothetical protein n=1 Tax=Pandoraea TaxID=93217 RepID=UPI001F5DE762|nr:hypothetical protein [Pandoraea capi]MCI3204391.1 hypothetical protein [Pandoraea sp. LA3]MDN4582418.1 hypothetical protein [Pandoraea capi]